jgi:hypothetical protein
MKRQAEKDKVEGKRLHPLVQVFRVVPVWVLIVAGTAIGQMKPGDVRKAYGEPRATVMESLLTTIYPGAHVQWDPYLTVQLPGQKPRMVQVPVSVRGRANGGLEGNAWIEFEGKKERFIFEAQNFRRSDEPDFPTELYVFRADAAGHIQKYKKFILDPSEPLTELKDISIQDWSEQEWPTLHIQYQTHRAAPSSFTTVEWHGTFDANTGRFISRLPFGISRRVKGGGEESYMFSLARSNTTTLQIGDMLSKKVVPYQCSDPCVVDADTLLSEWKLRDLPMPMAVSQGSVISAPATTAVTTDNPSPATIHLKNGRTIRADSANEVGDKIEYTVGESDYRIPKSVVQEIVHTANASPISSVADAAQTANPRSSPQASSQSGCNPDPRIPCHIVFYIQVLMGLGETQRFALFDNARHDVTGQAQWTILDFGSEVDFSVANGVPHIFSKKYGMVTLYGTVGDNAVMSRIYILKPEDIASNTMGRFGPPIFQDTHRPLELVPAAPYGGRIQ